MKKFLAFLVSAIIIACLGVVFYQFAKNDEIIKVEAKTIYINHGEKLSLDDIGFSRIEPSKETKINFNAGGDEVTSIIAYDEATKCYIPTSKGGSTSIKITTTNRKYKSFVIDVVVGIGTEECPYYISSENQLFSIGTNLSVDSHYKLINDITISSEHRPIGMYQEDGAWKYSEFMGHFDGGYNSINGLKISSCNYGGLFGILGDGSSVTNLEINNADISGEFLYAGTIAGICRGNINKVIINNSNISNTKISSYTGGLVGKLHTDETVSLSTTASILRAGIQNDENVNITSYGYVGGIAGIVDGAKLQACYAKTAINNKSNKATGGLVGEMLVDSSSYIRECYVVSAISAKAGYTGNIVGIMGLSNGTSISQINKDMVLMGNYYNNETNSYGGVGNDSYGFASVSSFAVNGCSTNQMKQKNTYIYYINSSNDIVYWENVWYIVDGEYPSLTYANKFLDISLDDTNANTPDIEKPDENISTNNIIISTKEDLIKYFQSSENVTGNYTLNADISLGGMYWEPINFQGSFKSSTNSKYKISNFRIRSAKTHVGFFSTLGNSNIENIKFASITIENSSSQDTVGALVGYIKGDTTINNVYIDGAKIFSTSKYAGGLAGYINSSIVKISDTDVNSIVINGKINNSGGFVGYVSSNTTINKCSVSSSSEGIGGYKRVGGIASTNYGSINSSSFFGKIFSVNQSDSDAYFAGISAVNYGLLYRCLTLPSISTFNPAKNITHFIAGVCGYNLGTVSYCCTTNGPSRLVAQEDSNTTYIAGLVGYNKGKLYKSGCEITEIGSEVSNTAGLAAYNYGGTITGCEASSNLIGNIVSGLILYNGNAGKIENCYAGYKNGTRNTYKGKYVSSLAYQLSSGYIIDNIVNAKLQCINASGYIAGFVCHLPYTSGLYGVVRNCIANVSLSGIGTKYLDACEEGLLKASQTTGSIKNCIISEDAKVDGVIAAEFSVSKFLFWDIKVYEPGSKSNYIVASKAQLNSIQTYTNSSVGPFSIDSKTTDSEKTWYFDSSIGLPIPRIVYQNTSLYPAG